LGNLIDNAIRYTPSGGRIDVSVTRSGDNAVIEVADNGNGIPAAERERVFDRFYRVEGSGAATGTGLGLAIVRAIAERHGGLTSVLDNPAATSGVLVRLSLPLGTS
jgi:signal transduction histidine kinase